MVNKSYIPQYFKLQLYMLVSLTCHRCFRTCTLAVNTEQVRPLCLYLQLFNAKKLSCRYVPHPYCIVSLNEVKVCRTQIKEAPDACWDEEFMLE